MHSTPLPDRSAPEGGRLSRRDVSGVLLLDKPEGLSSNAALQRARALLAARKAGHAGTLDPLATGLMVLCFGEATKFSGTALESVKGYRAWLRLGFTSTTGDGEGLIRAMQPFAGAMEQLVAVLARFRGVQTQRPPMHSALKVDGRPLYDYARAGQEVRRPERTIEVIRLDLEAWDGEILVLNVLVSKGTYVRTLAEDIGQALGCGAYLTGLRRLSSGAFHLADALTLVQLEALSMAERESFLLPVDVLLGHLPELVLDELQGTALCQGRWVEPPAGCPVVDGRQMRVYSSRKKFLGVGQWTGDGRLQPVRLMAE